MHSISFTKQLRKIRLVVLVLLSLLIVLTASPSYAWRPCDLWGCAIRNIGRTAGSEAAQSLEETIKYAIDNGVEVGVKRETFEGAMALTGYARAQAMALSNHVAGDIQTTVSQALNRTDESAILLNNLGKDFVSHGDMALEARIGQVFQGLKDISSDMNGLILATSQATESAIEQAGLETRYTVRSARDDLAALLSLSTEHVDFLLAQTGDELAILLTQAGDELAELIELSSDEAQEIIQTASAESQAVIREGGEVLNSVVENFNHELRLNIKDSREAVVYATDNLSEETQVVIETASENIEELIVETSSEVQKIVEAVKVARLEVIERGGAIVLYLVDRTADLVLAVFAATVGLIFLFVFSLMWGRGLLRDSLPREYVTRVIVFTLMGMNLIASFAPFYFLLPSVRAQVLQPMSLTKRWTDVVGEAPRIPDSPAINRFEPDTLIIQEADLASSESAKYLRVHGKELLDETLEVRFGDEVLPITGRSDRFLMIDLSLIYTKPDSANSIDIYIQGKKIASVPVDNQIPAEEPPELPVEEPPPAQEQAFLSITEQGVKNLITQWLEAKQQIFAPPFDQQLAAELTTGNRYNRIINSGGSIDWLKTHNAYYEFSSQAMHSVEELVHTDNKAIAVVILSESRTLYQNGSPIKSETDSWEWNHFQLHWVDKVWKISDYWTFPAFPAANCGDPPESNPNTQTTWYRVLIHHSSENLGIIRSKFCQNAFDARASLNQHFIQVAAFKDRSQAEALLKFLTLKLKTTGELQSAS